jgi:hypothetical protein
MPMEGVRSALRRGLPRTEREIQKKKSYEVRNGVMSIEKNPELRWLNGEKIIQKRHRKGIQLYMRPGSWIIKKE